MIEPRHVVVIGGGAAGLSGALTLARARRSVLVIDGGAPRNAPAEGVHGFLTRDGISPAELVRIGRDEVTGYGLPATIDVRWFPGDHDVQPKGRLAPVADVVADFAAGVFSTRPR